MANVFDVAEYILKERGPMTAIKLQKLVYYSQAWSLVWDEKPLFESRIEAWANGPVAPDLFKKHRNKFRVSSGDIGGDATKLMPEEKETIDAVLKHYGRKSSQWLSRLSHAERPWIEARKGLAPGERGSCEMTCADIADYYTSP